MTNMAQPQPHFFLVTCAAQGHINPTLQFAKRLLRLGVKVTFATCISAYRRMIKGGQVPDGIKFAVFSDGFDDGYTTKNDDLSFYLTQLRTRGKQSLKETILSCEKDNTPVTCLVYSMLLPWAQEAARDHNVPSAVLWIQPAAVFSFYYHYFNGYDKLIGEESKDPSWSIEIPGLPSLKIRDIPSFCLPSNTYDVMLPLVKEQFDILNSDKRYNILVNTFDSLEKDALKVIDDKLKMIAVGPLIPSAFLDGKDPSDISFGGDLFESSKEYVEWMNTKPKRSIVYISFGSGITLSKKQKGAVAHGLLEIRRPFLWVIRDTDRGKNENGAKEEKEEKEDQLNCMDELEELGLIVPWCSQLEVLSHPSLGCFVTHCGWNSTLESIVCGVPVVAFPHWTDQSTNAKLLEDVWGTGVRVTANEDGVVEGEEIRRCIEMVMGGHENGVELRKNAKKWKDLAKECMKESESSSMNLKAFVEGVDRSLKRTNAPIFSEEPEL